MATVQIAQELADLASELAQRMGMTQRELVAYAILEFAEDYADPRDAAGLAGRKEDGGALLLWAEELRSRLGLVH